MIERIHGRATFRRFGSSARRIRRGPLTVVVAERPAGQAAGVAYAVSRRVGPAVVRNRIRRQLRAALEEIDRDPGVLPGWYLVVVHPPARGQDFGALSGAVRAALSDGGRLEQVGST